MKRRQPGKPFIHGSMKATRRRRRSRTAISSGAVVVTALLAVVTETVTLISFSNNDPKMTTSQSSVVVSALSCCRRLQNHRNQRNHHYHQNFGRNNRLDINFLHKKRRIPSDLFATPENNDDEEEDDDESCLDAVESPSDSTSKSNRKPQILDLEFKYQQQHQQQQQIRRQDQDIDPQLVQENFAEYILVDIVSILVACELMQLLNVINSSTFVMNGGWFQPIPLIPPTLSLFIIKFSTTTSVWLLSSYLSSRLGFEVFRTKQNTDEMNSNSNVASSSKSWSFDILPLIRTIVIFSVLQTLVTTSISVLTTSGGGDITTTDTHFTLINNLDGIGIGTASSSNSLLYVAASSAGRDVYFVSLFVFTLRFLYRQYFF